MNKLDNKISIVTKAYFALVLGVAAVSTAAIFVKLSDAPSSIIAFYRLLFAFLIIAFPTLLLKRKEFAVLTRKDILYSVFSGIFLAFHFITWFASLKYTSVASSVVLVTLQPIFAMFGVYFVFKEKIAKVGVIGAILAVLGSLIIGWGDFKIGGQALYGDMLAILGAIFVTGYWLFGQLLRKKVSVLVYAFLVYGASTITLFLYNFALNLDFTNYSVYNWKLFLGLAVIPTIFGHTVFNWAIKYISAATISVTILAEPIGAIILAYIFLGEVITLTQLLGSAVIFSGIIVYLIFTNKRIS